VTRKPLIFTAALLLVISACAFGQDAGLSNLPSYKPEHKIAGAIRCFGSDLKGQVAAWQAGFLKYHPDAVFANNFMTSSEGAMAGLYTGLSDVAPAGDDAKITDQMPFFNTFRYLPLELSVATGGYEKRGTLWAIQIVVNKQNPISHLTMKQLDGIFGSERTGGWEGIEYTSKYARGPEQNIRTWGQLGLTGEWMLEELSKDKYGVAWAAVMHTKDYPEVKGIALAVQDSGPFVDLTPENVRNRTYPLIRDAYIYLNRTPARPLDPKVKEFMRYILSREGQEDVLRLGVYNPLTPEALAEQLKKLE